MNEAIATLNQRRQRKDIRAGDLVCFVSDATAHKRVYEFLSDDSDHPCGDMCLILDGTDVHHLKKSLLVHATDEEIELMQRLDEPDLIRHYGSYKAAKAHYDSCLLELKGNANALEFMSEFIQLHDDLRRCRAIKKIYEKGDQVLHDGKAYIITGSMHINGVPSVRLDHYFPFVKASEVRHLTEKEMAHFYPFAPKIYATDYPGEFYEKVLSVLE